MYVSWPHSLSWSSFLCFHPFFFYFFFLVWSFSFISIIFPVSLQSLGEDWYKKWQQGHSRKATRSPLLPLHGHSACPALPLSFSQGIFPLFRVSSLFSHRKFPWPQSPSSLALDSPRAGKFLWIYFVHSAPKPSLHDKSLDILNLTMVCCLCSVLI